MKSAVVFWLDAGSDTGTLGVWESGTLGVGGRRRSSAVADFCSLLHAFCFSFVQGKSSHIAVSQFLNHDNHVMTERQNRQQAAAPAGQGSIESLGIGRPRPL